MHKLLKFQNFKYPQMNGHLAQQQQVAAQLAAQQLAGAPSSHQQQTTKTPSAKSSLPYPVDFEIKNVKSKKNEIAIF